MDDLLQALKAVGESTRLRLLRILTQGEFNVSELTRIVGQSQPRVSRHLKLLSDARVLERIKEGSWVLFRLNETEAEGRLAQDVARLIPDDDPAVVRDQLRLGEVLSDRKEKAEAYFAANAANWHTIRALHVAESDVENAVLGLVGKGHVDMLVDLGTGTGRMLELLAKNASQAMGIDLSREMMAIARANLEAAGLPEVRVRHGDLFALPFNAPVADLVIVHQVLHFLDQPQRAVVEAARIVKAGGRLLIVDFAPHEHEFLREDHAHRRLGFGEKTMRDWLEKTGMEVSEFCQLTPSDKDVGDTGDSLTVSIWLAKKPNGAE